MSGTDAAGAGPHDQAGRRTLDVLAHDLINEVLAARLRLDALCATMRRESQGCAGVDRESVAQSLDAAIASLETIGTIAASLQALPDAHFSIPRPPPERSRRESSRAAG